MIGAARSVSWGSLRRLTFVFDSRIRVDTVSRASTSADEVLSSTPLITEDEERELRANLLSLGLVESATDDGKTPSMPITGAGGLEFAGIRTCLDQIVRVDRHVDGLLVSQVKTGVVQRLCRLAYAYSETLDGWSMDLATTPEDGIRPGMVFRSLSGAIEGRTTGGRRRCPARGCPGWLVGVSWETGQQMHLCSEGWHYDAQGGELHVVGGGEISARFVSPPPLGVEPLPRSQWPMREHLRARKAWSIRD